MEYTEALGCAVGVADDLTDIPCLWLKVRNMLDELLIWKIYIVDCFYGLAFKVFIILKL